MNTLKTLGDNPPHNSLELRLPAVKTPTINSSKPFADITPNYHEELKLPQLKLLLKNECCGLQHKLLHSLILHFAFSYFGLINIASPKE